QAEAIEVFLEAEGLFDGVEVGPLDVLDEGGFEDFLVVEVHDANWDGGEAGLPGGPQTPLAGNQLKVAIHATNHDRLHHAMSLDALAELRHLVVIKRSPGLVGILADLLQREGSLHVGLGRGAEQGVQTSAQASLLIHEVPSCSRGGAIPSRPAILTSSRV